jgi:acyl-coenzyme A synthetase/AMP-(fatty) acid ligase
MSSPQIEMGNPGLQHCRTRLKQFKVPKELQFMDSLPKNLIGKVERKELRNMTGTNNCGG